MPYRTILVHVDESESAAARIRLAARLARRAHGHLVGMAVTGVSRFLYPPNRPQAVSPELALHQAWLRERAEQALEGFRREMAAGAPASHEARLVDDEAGAGIALHARAAELAVIGQGAQQAPGTPGVAAEVVLHAGAPVLLLPRAGWERDVGRHVLLAWDAGPAAARALLLALPLLEQAETIQIAVFDGNPGSRTLDDANSADPRPLLARHGIAATLSVHAVDARRGARRASQVGEALLSLATDRSADLLVMGAYGHSRMRETLLGGVTRSVLDGMTVPVLMAH